MLIRRFIFITITALTVIGIGTWYLSARERGQEPASFKINNGAIKIPETPVTLSVPLERANERITKKPFSIKITPQTSPVQPERFSGYHTGTDFEIFTDEQGKEVAVFAICTGKLVAKRTASGYGGVLAQNCAIKGEPVVVVYGHMALSGVKAKVGDELKAGEQIGALGEQGKDTDRERKHLHLGIHKGTVIDIRGYVQSQSELGSWLDFQLN